MSRVSLSSSRESTEPIGAMTVVPFYCGDPSVAMPLDWVSLHDNRQAQAMDAHNTSGQKATGSMVNG